MSCWLNVYLPLNALSAVTVRNERPAIGSAALSSSPPVSVVIAACNEEKAILPTLDAVLHQEGLEVEVFVVGSGSTDETVRTVREFLGVNAEGFQKSV
jgi:cellulose synthase/poly-beta-1,6-N-acetylglucosamine synthase-like glycosyltransferase